MDTTEETKPKKRKQRPKTLQRNYKGPDWYLAKQSLIILHLLEADKNVLKLIDPGLDDPFAADFEAAINATSGELSVNVISAQLKGGTTEALSNLQLCRDKYSEVIYFARLAFQKNDSMLREFGKGSAYRKASRTHDEMFNFMTRLNHIANSHSAELIAKGYTQTKIDDILTVRDAWFANHSAQKNFKTSSPEITAARIAAYNTVHELTMQVIRAAKLAFKNDAAKLGEYISALWCSTARRNKTKGFEEIFSATTNHYPFCL